MKHQISPRSVPKIQLFPRLGNEIFLFYDTSITTPVSGIFVSTLQWRPSSSSPYKHRRGHLEKFLITKSRLTLFFDNIQSRANTKGPRTGQNKTKNKKQLLPPSIHCNAFTCRTIRRLQMWYRIWASVSTDDPQLKVWNLPHWQIASSVENAQT